MAPPPFLGLVNTPQGYMLGRLERQSASWGVASQATLHCLTGCAIGEVAGMVIGTALGRHNAATVVVHHYHH